MNIKLEAAILSVFIILGLVAWWLERKIWNNGICKVNGLPWEYFDTDSQGGKMYRAGDYTCTISWPFIDNAQQEQ